MPTRLSVTRRVRSRVLGGIRVRYVRYILWVGVKAVDLTILRLCLRGRLIVRDGVRGGCGLGRGEAGGDWGGGRWEHSWRGAAYSVGSAHAAAAVVVEPQNRRWPQVPRRWLEVLGPPVYKLGRLVL